MKKLPFCIGIMFSNLALAETVSINWMVGGSVYDTTSCTVGDTLNIPATNPTRYGYTFRGWATDFLQLEYISSSGIQWIDTGVTPSENIKIEVVGKQNKKDSALFGVSNKLYLFAANETQTFYGYGNLTGSFSENIANPLTSQKTIIMSKADGLVIDGTTYVNFSNVASFNSPYTITLFGRRLNDTGGVAKLGDTTIYYCKIWENGILVRNLIPAKRSSDAHIGMFDTVSQTFFENAGSGAFIAGPNL